jgi:hypothetical protein
MDTTGSVDVVGTGPEQVTMDKLVPASTTGASACRHMNPRPRAAATRGSER